MIKIAHFGDIHIHNLQRHDEYRIQFDKIYKILKKQQPDRIVIAGDLFEKFVEISNEAKTLSSEFLNKLSKIAKIIIVPGNHDIMKKNRNRLNSVYTVVNIMDNPNITYFGNSGFFDDGDIVWVNYSHLEKDVEPWVDIKHTKNKDKIYIALFHDPINGSMTNTKKFIDPKYKQITDFNKNDFVFLADIHKLQYFRKNKSAAYCGSTIQQNFGESPDEHGFIIWNIENAKDFTSEFIEIPNDNNYINFIVSTHTDYDNLNLTHPLLNPLSNIKINWTDLSANVNFENEVKIRDYFRETYNLSGIKITKNPQYTEVSDVEMVNESIDVLNPETHREIFVEYLDVNGYDEHFKQEILKIDDVISSNIHFGSENQGLIWNIEKIWFSNFKSYGDDVEIDFKKLGSNIIIQIAGENQYGKSTILDAITYILFGKTFATLKREKNGDNRYINKMRDEDYVKGGIIIDINSLKYTIVRETIRKWNREHSEITSTSTNVDYYKGDQIIEVNKITDEQKKDTQKLIESYIGTLEDFVRIVVSTADNMNDLLSMDRAVFIDSIIKDAGYDIFENKLEEFKVYRKNLIKNDIKIDIEVSKLLMENKELEEDILIEEEEKLQKELKKLEDSKPELQTKKDNLLASLDKIDDRIVNLDLDDINQKIETENTKITTRKEQLKKIGELKVELSTYNTDTIKNKRIEYDKIKDLINENNTKVGKYTNSLTEIKGRINTINMDIKNIIDEHIRSIEKESDENEIELGKIKDNFNTKVIEYSNVLKQDLNNIIAQKDSYKKDIDNFMEEGKKLKRLNDELETSKICITCERPLDNVDPEVINKKVEANKAEMSRIISKIKGIKPKYDELSISIDKYKNKLDKLSLKEYDFDIDLQNAYQYYIDKKNEISQTNSEIERRVRLIKDGNLPSEVQLKLKSSYDEKRIKNDRSTEIENEKKELEKIITNKEEELENLRSEIEELEKDDVKIQKKKEAIGLEEKVKSDIERTENLIKEYNKDIELYNLEHDKIENNKKTKSEIDTLNDMISLLEDDIKNKINEKTEIEKKIAVLDNEVENILKDITTYEKQKSRDEILDEYMKCVHRDGLPSFLLKRSIIIINNGLSNILTDVDFTLFFDKELNLKLAHDIKIEASQNAIESSGMERTFCALSLKIALRKLNAKSRPNFIMLDEITGKLTQNSIEILLKLLNNIKNEVDKLIIIEHTHPLDYDVLIEVIKDEKGISSLKIEE